MRLCTWFVIALFFALTPTFLLSQSDKCTPNGEILKVLERPPESKGFKVEIEVSCWDCGDRRAYVDAHYHVECTWEDGYTAENDTGFFRVTVNPGASYQTTHEINGCRHDTDTVTKAYVTLVIDRCYLSSVK